MPFDASGQWIPEDDSVAKRVAAISSSDSPLMQHARSSGMATVNRRGLMNSSMGIGAAQSAVLGAATPIASQDAQQTYGKNVQYMGDKTQTDINTRNLAAAERERQLAAITSLTGNTQNAISNTLNNSEIPGGTRAAVQRSINDQTAAAIAAMERLYGTNINWGSLTSGQPATVYSGIGTIRR